MRQKGHAMFHWRSGMAILVALWHRRLAAKRIRTGRRTCIPSLQLFCRFCVLLACGVLEWRRKKGTRIDADVKRHHAQTEAHEKVQVSALDLCRLAPRRLLDNFNFQKGKIARVLLTNVDQTYSGTWD